MRMSGNVAAARGTCKTRIMGVLNATPDSFYGPSRVSNTEAAVKRAQSMVDAGADIVDVGGESSRPGAEPVEPSEEQRRILPVIETLAQQGVQVSVDTYRAETAQKSLARGASMINDITALRGDSDMAGVIADSGAECVLMHMQGMPRTMQEAPVYRDVVDDLCAFFEERIAYATEQGIAENRLWLDPGFGFGKTVGHNLDILRRLDTFTQFGLPVLIGTSNKSTIGAVLDAPAGDRLEGTAATVAIAIWNGADCIRVHDVHAMARVARMTDAMMGRIQID